MRGSPRWFYQTSTILRTLGWVIGLGISSVAIAAMEEADQHFLTGYQAYLDKNYGECADENYKVVELGGNYVPRAKLYLAFCQVKLGNLKSAANYIQDIDPLAIRPDRPEDRELLVKLKEKLRPQIDELNRITFFVYPYGGVIGYSPGYLRRSATFFGLSADLFVTEWKFTLSLERAAFTLAPANSSFVQFQTLLGIQKTFGSLEVHTRGIYLYGDARVQDSIRVVGLGMSEAVGQERTTRVFVDGYYSFYPNSVLGPLTNIQVNLGVEFAVTRSEDFEVWLKLGSQTIFSSAPSFRDTSDPNGILIFVRKPFYERGFAELNFKASGVLWGATAGYGNEAFGVRNDGAVIYSGMEEHQVSLGGYLGVPLTDSLMIKGTYNYEQIAVGNYTFGSDTIFALLAFKF